MTRYRPNQHVQVTMKCSVCGHKQSIGRRKMNQREDGHIKPILCVKCGVITDHVQVEDGQFVPDEQ